ncbi:hypothetical protein H0W80_00740 [Candidatus Saccharibacteria bacterium]|nr:hypothetical protein [Candidatus Saccharibacteria bacterium]
MKGNIIIIILVAILILVLIIGIVMGYFNYSANHRPEQAEFNKGTVPRELPNGSYNGSATVGIGSWLGKSFDAQAKTGVNRFADSDRYVFTVYPGKGLTDSREVIKIDYNQPTNPWWLKFVTDEIVQVAPDEYLGKIQVNVLPGLPMTYGYFRLKK